MRTSPHRAGPFATAIACALLVCGSSCGRPEEPLPEEPAAQPATVPVPDTSTTPLEPPDEYAGWKTYRHPLGAAFRYPADWRVEETPAALLLVPPDHRGGAELIVAFGNDAGGVTDAADARVGQTLDAYVALQMPGLRRSEKPRAVATRAGAGAAYDWSGAAPDGRQARSRAYVVIVKGMAVGFSVLGEPTRFGERAPVVEKIFGSFGLEEAPTASAGSADRDPQLVGVFAGEALASGSGVYVNTQLVYALNADGTVLYGAQSAMNASQRDGDGNLRWTADGQTAANVQEGRWAARDGVLTMTWDGGATGRFAYGFEPDGSLVLRDPATRELIQFYSRVQ